MMPAERMRGYVLLDVLLAILLFSIGFASLYGLTENAVKQTQAAQTATEAANLAQSILEQLAANSWEDNFNTGRCIAGKSVAGNQGPYKWTVYTEWENTPDLLKVIIEVSWKEKSHTRSYELISLYDTK